MNKSLNIHLNKVKTQVKLFEEISEEEAKSIINNGYLVIYQHDIILIGKINKNQFHFADSSGYSFTRMQKMRIFNENEELYIWNTANKYKARYRKDNEGDNCHVLDARQVLTGTDKEELNNGFCRIFEKRGFELTLPDFGFEMPTNGNKRIAVLTRNYIGYTGNGQAGYKDCRFVNFVKF